MSHIAAGYLMTTFLLILCLSMAAGCCWDDRLKPALKAFRDKLKKD